MTSFRSDLRIPGSRKVQTLFRETGSMASVGLEAVRKVFSRPWPVAEFLDQCWFIAKVTTVPVILISIPFGMVISLQVGALIRQLGAESHLGSALVLAVVREQAPIATALLIAGAGGSAMTADIGARKIRDELDAMQVMSINPIQRLVMPRVLAATLIAVLLDAVVSAAGLAGGWFFGVNAQISRPMTTTAISATRPRRIQYTDGGCGPLPVSTSLMSQG